MGVIKDKWIMELWPPPFIADDDIIIRYEKGEIIGVTILHASKRVPKDEA